MKLTTLRLGLYETNCYILYDEITKTAVLTDPGYDAERILAKLEELGVTLQAVLLTHGHFDHVGAVGPVRSATGCRVYVHPADLELPEYMRRGLEYTDTYDEGDELHFGPITVRVMHTPGHSAGSVSLLVGNLLLCGDTLFRGGCGRTDGPGGSWTELSASLKRLAMLPRDLTVLPGHGDSTTVRRECLGNVFVRRALTV